MELKRVQSKNEAMTKELASEFLEMRKEDEEIDPSCYLQPDRYVRHAYLWHTVSGIV